MLPIVFEWQWDIGHIVFMGLFYAALGVVSLGIAVALLRTFKDLCSGKDPHEMHHH